MPKKGKKSTKAEAEAGAANLAKWKADNPAGGHVTHGGTSQTVRKRYSDRRTTQGKALQAIVDNIIHDLGGDLNQMQILLLNRIKEKLIVLMQIGAYVDKQETIIKDDGLISCLGSNYIAYDNALTRCLTILYDSGNKKPSRVPSIDDIIKANDNEHNRSDKK